MFIAHSLGGLVLKHVSVHHLEACIPVPGSGALGAPING